MELYVYMSSCVYVCKPTHTYMYSIHIYKHKYIYIHLHSDPKVTEEVKLKCEKFKP